MNGQEIVTGLDAEGQRLDRFVCERVPALGRAAARRLIEAGLVQVNGRRAVAGRRLHAGDRVALGEVPSSAAALPDPNAPLAVLYEDAWLVVVDKPGGVPAHPLRRGEQGTLASALVARYPEMAGVGYSQREPGILHRLDIDTSGVMLAARDAETFGALRSQLDQGALDKRYLALCAGRPEVPAVHEAWLSARGQRVSVRAQPFAGAHPVLTELLQACAVGSWSLLGVAVRRAHRHQVRAHLAALGHPIAGDVLYGGAPIEGLHRHFLHASELRFVHPRTGVPLALQAPLPAELQALLEQLAHA